MTKPRRHGLWILWISAVSVVLGGCSPGGVAGSGPTRTEIRNVDPFARVEVGTGIGLTVHVGGAQAVEVLAEENILALITTTVEGGVLMIRSSESFTTSTGVTVTVSVPELDGLSVGGGSQARVDGLESNQLSLNVSGGAGLAANGGAKNVTLSSTGGARADLAELTTEAMSLDLSGGATAVLNVSAQVTGSASGGAVVTIVGGATVNVQTSGGARVTNE